MRALFTYNWKSYVTLSALLIGTIFLSCVKGPSKSQNGVHLVLQVSKFEHRGGVDRNRVVIAHRIKNYGINKAGVYRSGDNRIVVQVPVIEDIGRFKEVIAKTGMLELRFIDENKEYEDEMVEFLNIRGRDLEDKVRV